MRNKAKLIRFLAERKMLDEPALSGELESHVYADLPAWKDFLRLLLLSLGLGFLACGILFFLAYNWADMPKAAKILLATAGVVVPVLLSLSSRFTPLVSNGLMTTGAFMVGGLFAVLGQIYQTGADAYDLFLAWWVFTLLWAIVVDFDWLWLLSLVLLNTTIGLYAEQVAFNWSSGTVWLILLLVNLSAFLGFSYFGEKARKKTYSRTFLLILALGVSIMAVNGFLMELFEPEESWVGSLLLLLVPVLLAASAYLAFCRKELAYLAITAISLITISTAAIFNAVEDTEGFFLASAWVLGTTVFSSFQLNKLRKDWYHDEQ
ncbi:DUF2157 domain-containing protein [Neolewinella agarilytica]|uniref:Predicted membrane protein n=1 Tax=Neolewinella agarilytica TaxID=478744 RepID=A0A1H8ZRQ1_9BACT|nr:DUF2157 domain-containing protein [Neolewinella agarilytica]SEP66923.1 Predicted membrane protein [Neolewinella agarilytica]